MKSILVVFSLLMLGVSTQDLLGDCPPGHSRLGKACFQTGRPRHIASSKQGCPPGTIRVGKVCVRTGTQSLMDECSTDYECRQFQRCEFGECDSTYAINPDDGSCLEPCPGSTVCRDGQCYTRRERPCLPGEVCFLGVCQTDPVDRWPNKCLSECPSGQGCIDGECMLVSFDRTC